MRVSISFGQLLLVLSVFLKQTNGLCDLSTGPAFQAGTIRVSIEEADTAFGPDITLYRKFIGLTDPPNSVTLTITQKNSLQPTKIDPSEFILEYLTDAQVAGGGTQTGYFIRPVSPIDRDGNTFSVSDDTTILEYTIECKPTDPNDTQGTNFFPIRINIVDINDNAPQFLPASYPDVQIKMYTPTGTTIIEDAVNANDKDDGLNREIVYGIVPGDGSAADGSTKFSFSTIHVGHLQVNQQLTEMATYILNISATDKGTPERVSYTTMTVTIIAGDDISAACECDTTKPSTTQQISTQPSTSQQTATEPKTTPQATCGTPSNSALCTNCRSLNLYAVVSLFFILSLYL
ncbi:cadherin-99C [Patella vulgata]|uniref:cadherin-99C n=1 Tax=Patella vulgata TaxID=6465 RepID=UPI0024A9ED3C|nr:cadherin-99C [Patella vulgata]